MTKDAVMTAKSNNLSAGLEDLHLGSQTGPTFDASYTVGKKLQGGSYGTVYLGKHNLSERECAIKVVDRTKLSRHDDEAQLQEVEILRSLNPTNFKNIILGKDDNNEQEDNGIINITDFYSSPETYHIIMELARGGDVFDRLAKRKQYTERHARDLARRMLQSIQFLHERGIAHRDIKPENLLLMDERSDTKLKLADFGFARRFDVNNPEKSMKTKCGTPAFVPPELVLGRRYGPKSDVWSAGCTLFMLLSGRAPFNSKKGGKNAMFHAIRAGDFVFYDDYWGETSMEAKKLVLSMLRVDPAARASPQEVLDSEWMQSKDDFLERRTLNKSLAEITSFNARRRLKGAIGAVMYAVGTKFWDIDTAAIWRDDEYNSDEAVKGDTGCGFLESYKDEAVNLPPTFGNMYKLESKLQQGVSATVWQGTSTTCSKNYAIKVIKREGLSQAEDAAVLSEVSILKSLHHKNIVPLRDFLRNLIAFISSCKSAMVVMCWTG